MKPITLSILEKRAVEGLQTKELYLMEILRRDFAETFNEIEMKYSLEIGSIGTKYKINLEKGVLEEILVDDTVQNLLEETM